MALQLRRGTNAQRAAMTPMLGELIYVTDSISANVAALWIGDGITAGGVVASTMALDALTDVELGVKAGVGIALANQQHLQFDSSTSQWRNVSDLAVTGNINLIGSLSVGGNSILGNALADATIISGGVAINGGAITTTATTASLFNTTATTLNIGNAATILSLGATTGTTTVRNSFVGNGSGNFGGNLNVAGSAAVTGALVVSGALSIAGNTSLGDTSSDSLTINAGSVLLPSGSLNFDNSTLVIDSVNNRIGVLKAVPTEALDIVGNIKNTGDVVLGSGYLKTGAVTGGLFMTSVTNLNIGNAATAISIGAATGTITLNNPALAIPNGLNIGSNQLYLDPLSGFIGIGNAAPAYKLDVSGSVRATGDIQIQGGDLVATGTSFNLVNTNIATLNIGGVATSLNLGAATGTTTIKNAALIAGDLQVGVTTKFGVNATTGDTRIYSITASTTQDEGALKVDGGVGIKGRINVGGDIRVDSTTQASDPLSGSIQTDGGLGVLGNGRFGGVVSIDDSQQSTSPTTGSLQTDGGLGVVGNAYIGGIGYIAGELTVGGNLTVNGTLTSINSTTLTVDDKNIELGSIASPTDITANGGGITLKGTTDKTFNWVSTSNHWESSQGITAPELNTGNIRIATGSNDNTITTASGNLELAALTNIINVTGNVTVSGDLALNGGDITTTAATTNVFNGATTLSLGGAALTNLNIGIGSVAANSNTIINSNVDVAANLIVRGSTQLGNDILNDITSIVGKAEIGSSTHTTMFVNSNTQRVGINNVNPVYSLDVVGTANTTGVARFSSNLNIKDIVSSDAGSLTTSTTANQVLDSYALATYRTVKYVMQATSSGAGCHSLECLVMHDGTNAYITVYGEMFTGVSLTTISVAIVGSNVELQVTPTNAITTYKVTKTLIAA